MNRSNSHVMALASCVALLLWSGCAVPRAREEALAAAATIRANNMSLAQPTRPQTAPSKLSAPRVDPARQQRVVIYSASLCLVVPDVRLAMESIRATASSLGGYLQSMSAREISVKVPADRFEEAIDAIEKLGEVTSREIRGSDVTEQMRDLRTRLSNAEQMRERLLALLEKSQKVEDALAVEKELGRVTEQIELLKGKIQYLEHNVAFSSIRVVLNSPVPKGELELKVNLPFAWPEELGSDLLRGYAGVPGIYHGLFGLFPRRVKFDLPEGYVKYYERNYLTRAMSAEGVFLRVERRENYKNGTAEFWGPLIRRVLAERKSFSVISEEPVTGVKGRRARVIFCTRQIGAKHFGYLVAVAPEKKHVYLFEAWGPKEAFEADRGKLIEAVKSMR